LFSIIFICVFVDFDCGRIPEIRFIR